MKSGTGGITASFSSTKKPPNLANGVWPSKALCAGGATILRRSPLCRRRRRVQKSITQRLSTLIGEPPLRGKRAVRSRRKTLEIADPVIRPEGSIPVRGISGLRIYVAQANPGMFGSRRPRMSPVFHRNDHSGWEKFTNCSVPIFGGHRQLRSSARLIKGLRCETRMGNTKSRTPPADRYFAIQTRSALGRLRISPVVAGWELEQIQFLLDHASNDGTLHRLQVEAERCGQ